MTTPTQPLEPLHTPGPWELIWEDGKHGVIGATTEKKLVAIVGNNPDDGRNDIRKANAELIARAPDMLAEIATLRATITRLEQELASVSRELVSTDNADRYYRGFNAGFDHAVTRLEKELAAMNDLSARIPENDGRRWWRIKRGEESRPVCVTIDELEWYFTQGYVPEYPLQVQPLLIGLDAPPSA